MVSSPSVGNNIVPGSLGLLGTPYRTHETFVTPKWIFALVSPLADIRRRLVVVIVVVVVVGSVVVDDETNGNETTNRKR